MTTLPRALLQRALTLALEAGHAADAREFADVVLDGAHGLVGCDIVSYNEVAVGSDPGITLARPDDWMTPERLEAFWRHVDEHPLVAHYARTGDGRALRISDVVTRDRFHSLGVYTDFFAGLGIEHQIAVTLPAPQPIVVGIAFNRSGRRDFSERDRAVLNTIRPYLATAHAAVRERERTGARLRALEQAIDEVSDGIVLLASDGRVEHANSAARALVRGVLGAELGSRLPAELGQPVVERGTTRLYVRRVGGEVDTGVLLLSTAPPPDAHGLTPRELEVLASAADGLTATQIALRLGISERTVERHLQNGYRKLGVHGRAAAVARVFGTPVQALAR